MLSVENSCHHSENSKNGKNCSEINDRPSKLPQQIPGPQTKSTMQNPHGEGKDVMQIPGGARGMVMAKTEL